MVARLAKTAFLKRLHFKQRSQIDSIGADIPVCPVFIYRVIRDMPGSSEVNRLAKGGAGLGIVVRL